MHLDETEKELASSMLSMFREESEMKHDGHKLCKYQLSGPCTLQENTNAMSRHLNRPDLRDIARHCDTADRTFRYDAIQYCKEWAGPNDVKIFTLLSPQPAHRYIYRDLGARITGCCIEVRPPGLRLQTRIHEQQPENNILKQNMDEISLTHNLVRTFLPFSVNFCCLYSSIYAGFTSGTVLMSLLLQPVQVMPSKE